MQRCLPCHASISIHALREEGDLTAVCNVSSVTGFLSTPSARRATSTPNSVRCCCTNFYPRPPRGGRRSRLDAVPPAGIFLSTPSARRATLCRVLHRQAGRISIHALREEGDQGPRSEAGHRTDFYPRPPRGGRRVRFLRSSQRHNFYPRPPRGGRHRSDMAQAATIQFLSTPSARRATGDAPEVVQILLQISIHALREEGDLVAVCLPLLLF